MLLNSFHLVEPADVALFVAEFRVEIIARVLRPMEIFI
jgi:hypothetical protein